MGEGGRRGGKVRGWGRKETGEGERVGKEEREQGKERGGRGDYLPRRLALQIPGLLLRKP